MDDIAKILADFFSFHWWVTVVVVSAVVNLATSYVKSPIDQWLSTKSSKRREEREQREQKDEEFVQFMVKHPLLITNQGIDGVHDTLYMLFYLAFSMGLYALSGAVFAESKIQGKVVLIVLGLVFAALGIFGLSRVFVCINRQRARTKRVLKAIAIIGSQS